MHTSGKIEFFRDSNNGFTCDLDVQKVDQMNLSTYNNPNPHPLMYNCRLREPGTLNTNANSGIAQTCDGILYSEELQAGKITRIVEIK